MRQFRIICFFACLLATAFTSLGGAKGGIGAGAISLPSGPGSVEGLGGSFEPQLNSGTVNYGVSLPVPAGRSGLTPSISLSYEGGSGNGSVGFGWGIGAGSIKRKFDKGFPQFNAGDTFVLGGEELVPLSNVEKDWRCENDRAFQRVRQKLDNNAWEVTDPDGTVHSYGAYRGEGGRLSAIMNPLAIGAPFDQTYLWMLDSTVDVHGNRIEYEYEPGEGALYLSRITWSHWVNNGITNYYEVRLAYEPRPDVFDDYRAGFLVQTDRRLATVAVNVVVGGVAKPIRSFRMDYDYRPEDFINVDPNAIDTGVSMLKRVMFFGADGNTNNYLPTTLFGYTPLDLSLAQLQSLDPAPDLNLGEVMGNVQLTDIDGDGLPDLFQTTDLDQRFQLNRGVWARDGNAPALAFDPVVVLPRATAMLLSDPEAALLDYDGDGLVDYIQLQDDLLGGRQMEIFRNASTLAQRTNAPSGFLLDSDFSYNLPAWVTLKNPATKQADINFDKLADFITTEPGFLGQFRCAYRDVDGNWQEIDSDYPPDMPGALTFAWNGASNTPAVYLADMNGDRLQDIVLVEQDGNALRVRYWPGTGLGTWGSAREMGVISPDILTAETADLRDIFIQDLTGDGLADLLMVDGSSDSSRIVLRVNVSGDHWAVGAELDGLPRFRPRDPSAPTTFRLVDLNGNGSTDLLWVNPGMAPGWQWLELMPQGKANLLHWTDNGIGRFTEVTYGTSTDDLIRAREAGFPWLSTTPFPVPVIRRLRITPNLDLDGLSDAGRGASTDQYVTEFEYRDGYYDPFEKEFRGFAFAQKVEYGDDFLMDTNLVTLSPAVGWDASRSPSGQFNAPSLVTRLHFHTGAPDGIDNDEYPPGYSGPRYVDEVTPLGGREEEPLKGVQLGQEMVDGWVLHGGASVAGFDQGCYRAATAANVADGNRMTPDDYVYGRVVHQYTIRRLYRSDLPQPFTAATPDGIASFDDVLTPAGRFSGQSPPVTVLPQSGHTVSQVFIRQIDGFQLEANAMFQTALSFPARPPTHNVQNFDQDDYGNEILHQNWGFVDDPSTDDERFVSTQYALDGAALANWIIRLPAQAETTDENGVFVNRTRHYYDGPDFVGLPLGQVGPRGLETRTENFINGDSGVPGFGTPSPVPGDPRLPIGSSLNSARASFDASGNMIVALDPLGDPAHPELGHTVKVTYDADFNMYCTSERTVVGGGLPDHVVSAAYDPRWGVVTASTNANGHPSFWTYDTFGRVVAAVRPGDSQAFPTIRYQYLPADPLRNRVYRYDGEGNLTLAAEVGPATRIVSRQREQAGQPGEFVSVAYHDGLMREIAVVHEGDFGGHWIVHKASTFSHRSGAAVSWLPFDFLSGSTDADIPALADFWRNGRPLIQARDGAPVVGTQVFADALGRELFFINAPESTNSVSAEPLFRRTWRLPREQMVFDEEDTSPTSPHANTPLTIVQDGLGRIIEQTESARLDDTGHAIGSPASWTTRYAFDLNDNVVLTTDSQGNQTSFRYDAVGRNIYINDPDRGVTTMTYDNASNHTQTTDAKGQTIVYQHDGHNRLLSVDYLDQSDPDFSYGRSPDVEFHYDVATNTVSQGDGTVATPENTVEKLVWASDTAGAVHFSYDARGRVEWQVREINHPAGLGPVPFRMAWAYDSFDRTVQTTFPDNDRYSTHFGSRNLIDNISGSLLTVVSNITYIPAGKISQIFYGNGVVTAMTYDPRLRTRRLQTRQPGGAALIDYAYSYDGLSNVKEIDDIRPESIRPSGSPLRNSQSFQYDDLYRLSLASYSLSASGFGPTPDGAIAFRYDRIGNMLEERATGIAANGNTRTSAGLMAYGGSGGTTNHIGRTSASPGPHALTGAEDGSVKPSYDGVGNVLQMNGTHFTWDFEDRLVEADNGSQLASYRYSLENVRMSRYVRPKPGATNGTGEEVVLYPFPGFEVRPGNSAEKLISMPGLPLVRISASLSSTPRVQRLELQPGWNLVSIPLTVTNLGGQLSAFLTPGVPVFRADAPVGPPALLTNAVSEGPGAYWVHAAAPSVASVVGAVVSPSGTSLPEGPSFIATTAPGRWKLPADVQTNGLIWRLMNPDWLGPVPLATGGSPDNGWVAGGEVIFVRLNSAMSLPPVAGKIAFFHGDHLGSTSVMTDSSGNRTEEATWYPFGGERSRESLVDDPEPYGFTGHENDGETGLNYMTERYEAPEFARFLSVDPKLATDPKSRLHNPQGLNFYAYALNNPITWRDPSGCDVELDPLTEAVHMEGAQRAGVDPDQPFQISGWSPAPANETETPSWLQKTLGSADGKEESGFRIGKVDVSVQRAGFEGELLVGLWLGNKDILSFENAITLKKSTKGAEICGNSGGIIADAKYVFTLAKACHNFTTGENTFKTLELQREPKMSYGANKTLRMGDRLTIKGFKPQVHFNMKETAVKGGTQSGLSTSDFSVTAGVQGGGEVSISSPGLGVKPITVSGTLKGVVGVEFRKKGADVTLSVVVKGEAEAKVVIGFPSTFGLVNIPIIANGKGETRVIARWKDPH